MRPASLLLLAALAALPLTAQVKITSGSEKISVEIDGKPYTDFYVAGPTVTKPYLWPLRAPSGTQVTRMWPMEKVEEEAPITKPDHQHQRGLWFAHDSVNKLDFWNNEATYTTPNRGKITLKKIDEAKGGKDTGTIKATFEWADIKGDAPPLLTETRVMTFHAGPGPRIIDFDITLTALQKVTFGDGKDGAFGVRMRPVLNESKPTGMPKDAEYKVTGHITNADGLAGESQLWGKPSNWCDYSGEVNGETVGIAILDYPANPHHPVRWHARGYGLFAANPFGQKVFDKSVPDSPITVEPGQSLRYRYRVIVHGKDANLPAEWEKYSKK